MYGVLRILWVCNIASPWGTLIIILFVELLDGLKANTNTDSSWNTVAPMRDQGLVGRDRCFAGYIWRGMSIAGLEQNIDATVFNWTFREDSY